MNGHRTAAVVLFLTAIGVIGTPHAIAQPSGADVYQRTCRACHESSDGRTPPVELLRGMTATRILRTLDFGSMMTVAYPLRRDEREAVAAFLGKPGPEPEPSPKAFCSDRRVALDLTERAWNGWSHASDNTRFVPGAVAGLSAADVPNLRLKWAFGFAGDVSAFAQPTVIGDDIFVGSAGGVVHALSAASGCIRWIFHANGPIRSSIVAAPLDGGHVVLFGDLTGWFYALDAATGQLLWKKRPDDHESVRLSAAPLILDGVAIIPVASWEESRSLNTAYACCTFRGSLTALRVRDGSDVWKTYLVPTPAQPTGKAASGADTFGPSGVGVWTTPTLDLKRRRLYVGTGNNYSRPATSLSDAVVALDVDTGRIVWSAQVLTNDVYNSACSTTPRGPTCPEGSGPDHDFASPPILLTTTRGRELLIAGHKSGIVWAFDPDDNGRVVWQRRIGQGGINGGIQWGIASDGQRVYAAVSDVAVVRTATTRTLDPSSGGGLAALDPSDGTLIWRADPPACGDRPNCSPAQSAALTAITGLVFSGSVDGHIRAYTATDGRIVWDFDTAREFETVNGVKARGGAIDGPGVLIANGVLLVNSGYSRFGGAPGNVLLAFEPQR